MATHNVKTTGSDGQLTLETLDAKINMLIRSHLDLAAKVHGVPKVAQDEARKVVEARADYLDAMAIELRLLLRAVIEHTERMANAGVPFSQDDLNRAVTVHD